MLPRNKPLPCSYHKVTSCYTFRSHQFIAVHDPGKPYKIQYIFDNMIDNYMFVVSTAPHVRYFIATQIMR